MNAPVEPDPAGLDLLRRERWGSPARRLELEQRIMKQYDERGRLTNRLRAHPLLAGILVLFAASASFAAGAAIGGWEYWVATDADGQEHVLMENPEQVQGRIVLPVETGEGEELIEVLEEDGGMLLELDGLGYVGGD